MKTVIIPIIVGVALLAGCSRQESSEVKLLQLQIDKQQAEIAELRAVVNDATNRLIRLRDAFNTNLDVETQSSKGISDLSSVAFEVLSISLERQAAVNRIIMTNLPPRARSNIQSILDGAGQRQLSPATIEIMRTNGMLSTQVR